MDPERNAATLQRLYDEVMNGHNVDAADELITIDRPDHDSTFPPEFTAGRAGFKKLMTMLIGAFPDLRFTTELIVADNDLASAFTKVSGTHQGEFMGSPATGRSFLVHNADFCRFTDDGLICEHWGLIDTASLMHQLGIAGQDAAGSSQ
jgi:predicted ester cyclase